MNNEMKSLSIRAAVADKAVKLAECGEGDNRVVIWDLGFDLVAETNGDPVWQQSHPEEFLQIIACKFGSIK